MSVQLGGESGAFTKLSGLSLHLRYVAFKRATPTHVRSIVQHRTLSASR